MGYKVRCVDIRCDDRAEVAVLMRSDWDDGDVWYELNIEDSYCGGRSNIANRFKRAWCAFWDKPIYYSGIFVSDGARMKEFLTDCVALVDSDSKGSGQNDGAHE